MSELAIIGGGSWGTALAIVLAPRFDSVRLWAYEAEVVESICAMRENALFLPDFALPANVSATSDLRTALTGAHVVLSVVPSAHLRSVYQRMIPYLSPRMLFVSATKGIENGTLLRMSQVIAEVLPFDTPVAVISGPTFAREVARGAPTALVAASTDLALAEKIQRGFSGPTFRLYTNNDPAGVEIGGAVKNVIAIGAGVCHGLGLGSNALAALITRGVAEIGRLAAAAGGQPKTLAGLAGLGDLVLTCNGELSRNRTVGLELAKGRSIEEIVSSMRMVAEGVETTRATVDLAHKMSVEMPISNEMHAMLNEKRAPEEAIRRLMERELKGE
jgi:glycerol-3-phosphate dehydrogenase (NAD(P)+)